MEKMRQHVAATKAGLVAFKQQMAAEEAEDAKKQAEAAPPPAPAAGAPNLVAAAGGAVELLVATAPGKSDAQKLADMAAVALTAKASEEKNGEAMED